MIIIITNKDIKCEKDVFVINNTVSLIDDYHLSLNNQIIEFDYLIIDELKLVKDLGKINILTDDNIPVTNCYGETTLDNIFYGNPILCLNYLRNGD